MLKKSLYVMCTASLLSAATTMCYKKDHLDPSTIENIALDGGVCAGKLSVQAMQKDGYEIDSMKLQEGKKGFNYIYVFTKNTQKTGINTTSGVNLTDAELTARLENIQKKQKKEVEVKRKISTLADGKELYETTCKRCHGDGTIRAYNTARPLKEMSLEDMQVSIRDYTNGSKDNGMSVLMIPYANTLTKKDIDSVYNYLNTIK